jgi:hypothetical protein
MMMPVNLTILKNARTSVVGFGAEIFYAFTENNEIVLLKQDWGIMRCPITEIFNNGTISLLEKLKKGQHL